MTITRNRIIASVIVSLHPVLALAAWTAPSGTPPANNAPEPINVSATDQFKQGTFGAKTINIFGTSQYLSFGNAVGSGVPGIRFNVNTSQLEYSNGAGAWSALGQAPSQWTTSGSNIYFNTGNVGIGNSSSSARLSVSGGTTTGIAIDTANEGPWALTIRNNAAPQSGLGFYQNNDGRFHIYNAYGMPNQGNISFGALGSVGVGTTTPSAQLTVGAAPGSAGNSYYNVGADKIAAGTSIYSYGRMCVGNNAGNCLGTGGTVIRGDGVQFPDGSVQATAASIPSGTQCGLIESSAPAGGVGNGCPTSTPTNYRIRVACAGSTLSFSGGAVACEAGSGGDYGIVYTSPPTVNGCPSGYTGYSYLPYRSLPTPQAIGMCIKN